MINIDKLTPADVGRWVSYCVLPPHCDRGRIKSWTRKLVYVVCRCGGHWDEYADYTAAPTLPDIWISRRSLKTCLRDSAAMDGEFEILAWGRDPEWEILTLVARLIFVPVV